MKKKKNALLYILVVFLEGMGAALVTIFVFGLKNPVISLQMKQVKS